MEGVLKSGKECPMRSFVLALAAVFGAWVSVWGVFHGLNGVPALPASSLMPATPLLVLPVGLLGAGLVSTLLALLIPPTP